MSDKMRQRLGRALHDHKKRVLKDHGFPGHETWSSPDRKAAYVAQAMAVVDELQNPSEEMLIAGNRVFPTVLIQEIWRAMIQCVLNETDTKSKGPVSSGSPGPLD